MLVFEDLGRYLRFQLFSDGSGHRNFRDVVDKMSKRLKSWKVKTLSMARRVILVKIILSSLPLYQMQLL